MTDLSHGAVTAALGDTLANLHKSQQAVKDAAAGVYTGPAAPPVEAPTSAPVTNRTGGAA